MIMEDEKLNDSVPPEITIKYLLKEREIQEVKIRKLKQTIGELKSYVQELEWKISNISNGHKEFNKEIKREDMYKNITNQIAFKDKRIKALKDARDSLIQKVNELENKLKEK